MASLNVFSCEEQRQRSQIDALASYTKSRALIDELVAIDPANIQRQEAYERELALLAALQGGDTVFIREETQQIKAKLQRLRG